MKPARYLIELSQLFQHTGSRLPGTATQTPNLFSANCALQYYYFFGGEEENSTEKNIMPAP